ncbi:MAG TPA: CDP-alcohol phosphatidyltransferase family protein [Candidatus Udaeobacter sp.]|nr:CDP-alcohol phosphatidyltransferase family protein [Candidatus Udaeobacter sp.]
METNKPFAGDKKVSISLFGKLEKKLVEKYVDKIPQKIETYHLTLSTMAWCAFIVLFGYLAGHYNIHWLWGTSIMIVFQYLTDLFDGAVGRHRNTGLIHWGYYMDHFLDYIFLCSILIGYSFIYNDKYNTAFFILVSYGAFMVNSFLSFAATNEFRISYFKIGPTETRLAFIITNTLITFFHGHVPLARTLPYIFGLSIIGLTAVVYTTQKLIWEKDMKNKKSLN